MTQLSLSSWHAGACGFHEENGYTVFRVRPKARTRWISSPWSGMGSPQAGVPAHQGPVVNNARFGRQVQMGSFESLLSPPPRASLYLASADQGHRQEHRGAHRHARR
ncbi:MAG: hypothetical protein ACLR7Z_04990 [Bilophila wadsworthia]